MKRLFVRFLNDPLSLLVSFYLLAKCVLYLKLRGDYLTYVEPENDFFPALLYYLNPLYLDLLLIFLVFLRSRTGFFVALLISVIQVTHPHSIGVQHYVMSSVMFLWLALKDNETHSIFFGRVALSFLFMTATIGKLTPGWIGGEHYETYLTHLSQNPYLIIGGEFFNGISFLLPFYVGVVGPIIAVIGMLYSINLFILDAVGPILGMYLTFIILKESKPEKLSIAFSSYDVFPYIASNLLRHLDFPAIEVLPYSRAGTAAHSVANPDEVYEGYAAYCEVVARIPFIAFLYPLMKIARYRRTTADVAEGKH